MVLKKFIHKTSTGGSSLEKQLLTMESFTSRLVFKKDYFIEDMQGGLGAWPFRLLQRMMISSIFFQQRPPLLGRRMRRNAWSSSDC
jgi:hypothetical protein